MTSSLHTFLSLRSLRRALENFTLMASSIPNYFSKAPSPNAFSLVVRMSTYEFRGGHKHSVHNAEHRYVRRIKKAWSQTDKSSCMFQLIIRTSFLTFLSLIPHQINENKTICLIGLFWILNEIISPKLCNFLQEEDFCFSCLSNNLSMHTLTWVTQT